MHADIFHHTVSSRIQLLPCAATNEPIKKQHISEDFYKRHQLKEWFIISSMPLLPIKDRDGDKEAVATAGRQQKGKYQDGKPLMSKSHHALLPIAPQVEPCWKIYQNLPSLTAINIHCWQGNIGNPILTPLWAFSLTLQSWMGGNMTGSVLVRVTLQPVWWANATKFLKKSLWGHVHTHRKASA